MKKIYDLLRPNVLLIFGSLFLLYYLNYLAYGGAGLAIGIIAVVFASYYLVVGILGIVLAGKINDKTSKIFEVINVSLFAIFLFVYTLLLVINAANGMGPTAWVIQLVKMISSLAVCVFCILVAFVNKPVISRLASLFYAIFTLSLLLTILFAADGSAIVLGNIDVLLAVMYALFIFYLFSTLRKPENLKEDNSNNQNEDASA